MLFVFFSGRRSPFYRKPIFSCSRGYNPPPPEWVIKLLPSPFLAFLEPLVRFMTPVTGNFITPKE